MEGSEGQKREREKKTSKRKERVVKPLILAGS